MYECMKRTLIMCLCIFIYGTIFAQNIPFPVDENNEIKISKVVDVDLTKESLFSNCRDWIAKTFGDYKKVLQFEDKDAGKVIIKGVSNVKYKIQTSFLGIDLSNSEQIRYTITIECKDSKYRYTIDNIILLLNLGGEIEEHSLFYRVNRIKESNEKVLLLENELVELKKKDTSSYKKKQIKEHQLKISKLEERIESCKNNDTHLKFLESEISAINNIIASLESSMKKNDDF